MDWRTHPKADQAVNFFKNLTLIGDYEGQRWDLEDWQEDLIREIYGRRTEQGTRLTSTVSLWMPRGLGKTQLAAGLALYELVFGPPGREVYAAGPDRDKAGRLFKAMSQMIRNDPHLLKLCDVTDHYLRIKIPTKNSVFMALAMDSDQGHSLAPSTLICDEIHLWRSRALYDALTSGFQKRKSGSTLEVQISTAGNTRTGLAWDLYSHAKSIKSKVIDDPKTVVRIFEAEEKADWTSEEVWRQCMPCKYINFEKVKEACEKAKHIRHLEQSFRQLYLGQWIEHTDEAWVDPEEWRACEDNFTEDDLAGQSCVASLDLSSVRDLTSLSLFFPDSNRVLSWSWLPAVGLAEREDKDGVPYRAWERQGHLLTTTGGRIVHEEVANKVNEILRRFDAERLVADPYSLHLIAPYLDIEPERYPQSPAYLSPPTKWLESAIAERKIKHNGNPLLSWCMSNVVVDKDKYENISPHKGKSRKRIDPVVALVMAVGAWLGGRDGDVNEFYSNRENLIFDSK